VEKQMIYDLSQPIFDNVPQWPKCSPSTMTIPHLAAIEPANVMLDGRTLHFAVFPVLIQGCGGAWTRAVAWDEEEMA
jgi:kynurenine formamidase